MNYAVGSVVGFTTAQPGWQVTLGDDSEEGYFLTPLVGWATVIQETEESEAPITGLEPAFLLEGSSIVTKSEVRDDWRVYEVLAPGEQPTFTIDLVASIRRWKKERASQGKSSRGTSPATQEGVPNE